MKITHTLRAGVLGVFALAPAALAQTDPGSAPKAEDNKPSFSASFAFTNDYVFRGISRTGGKAAIQGSFDLTHKAAGVPYYLGVWASNIDFGTQSNLEVDLYGGIRPEFAGLNWDLGFTYFYYPGRDSGFTNRLEYVEFNAGASKTLGIFTFGGKTSISPNFQLQSGRSYYAQGTALAAINKYLSVDGLIGRQWIRNNANFGTPDYTTWQVGATLSFPGTFLAGFSIDGRYIDSDLARASFPIADSRGVVTVKRTF